MNLRSFAKQLSDFYEEMQSIADEAVGGFAIDSLHGGKKKKKKKVVNPLEEDGKVFNRVMIDFDKTIYSAKSGFNNGALDDDPFPDAKDSIDELKKRGVDVNEKSG